MREPVRFMVVDDNRTNNLICEFTIRKYKKEAEIDLFIEPEVALQHIRENYGLWKGGTFTVLFLDINMPSMTGWEFLDEFRSLGKDVHKQFVIYMLTSSVDERDKEKAEINPLVSGFLSKPLTLTVVHEAVDGLTDRMA